MVLLQNPNNGDHHAVKSDETLRFSEDLDSSCSTPYVSAPSSPGRDPPAAAYFFSAPASPMHYVLTSSPSATCPPAKYVSAQQHDTSLFEFEFSSRYSGNGSMTVGSMSSADELFLNGQIRPMKLSSHLQRPQLLAPLIDIEGEDDETEGRDGEVVKPGNESMKRGRDLKLRSKSLRRKARSLSPLRNGAFHWREDYRNRERNETERVSDYDGGKESDTAPSVETTPSSSASSSGRNSKKWIFLKDLLRRSKSEGRENGKEKFLSSIAFSPKEKKLTSHPLNTADNNNDATISQKQKSKQKQDRKQATAKKSLPATATGKPENGVARRRMPVSAHELHYTANRAQAEEMKKRTYLPYRQGLFGCLGFSSKGYGALNGLARTLNPVSSR